MLVVGGRFLAGSVASVAVPKQAPWPVQAASTRRKGRDHVAFYGRPPSLQVFVFVDQVRPSPPVVALSHQESSQCLPQLRIYA